MSGQDIYFNYTGYYEDNVIDSNMNTNFIPEEIEVDVALHRCTELSWNESSVRGEVDFS